MKYNKQLLSSNIEADKAALFWENNMELFKDSPELLDDVFASPISSAQYYFNQFNMDLFRRRHAERSRQKLIERIAHNLESDFIPLHMRIAVADCCKAHDGGWSSVDSLAHREDGIYLDYIHPKFVSALLRLGDLLDMDTTRFNPYFISYHSRISPADIGHLPGRKVRVTR